MNVSPKVLLVTPPFTQLNTPYPAMMYLKGFLNTKGVDSVQVDLSLEVILEIFSSRGLHELFQQVAAREIRLSGNARRIFALQEEYERTIDAVMAFLQGRNRTLAYSICESYFLPRASRFEQEEDTEWAFGVMGLEDKARYLSTLYLEDLSDFLQETVDEHFGFSRYAEYLGRSASSFDELNAELAKPLTFTDHYLIRLLAARMKVYRPEMVAITVPFPGNLYSALRCGEWIKANYPEVTVAMGGGFANTELRSLTDVRFFHFTDYLLLDDGELPLVRLLEHVTGQIGDSDLVRTFCLRDGKVEFLNDESAVIIPQKEVGVPDYSGLLLDRYVSVIEIVNPMHKLWSDGRWNKLTLAHGCYWGKCSFCDGSLDYIRRYEPNEVKTLVDRMEQVMAQTGEGGFHFVDEAAPPALLKELALEILRRRLMVVWWGNVRFERAYTRDLCRLLKASGCIAVSGGVEVASDRVLGLINKGVTLEQLTRSANHFTGTGIMVHAYLMYGFPTETTQETVDSLEVVRQLFELGYIHSGFWHRFAMTAHSPVGLCPERFGTRVTELPFGGFARNDVAFEDLQGGDHDELGDGLSRSLYNYMRGVGFDLPLQKWFDCKIPATTIPPRFVAHMAEEQEPVEKLHSRRLCWLGGRVELGPESVKKGKYSIVLLLHTNNRELAIKMRGDWAHFIHESLMQVGVDAVNPYLLEDFSRNYEILFNDDFLPFWYGKEMQAIRDNGLLLL